MSIFQIDTAIWLTLITTIGGLLTLVFNTRQKRYEMDSKFSDSRLDKTEARLDRAEEREETLRERIGSLEGTLAQEVAKNIRMTAHAAAYIHKLQEHINARKPPPPPTPSTGVMNILNSKPADH